jgi:hypothetical protein
VDSLDSTHAGARAGVMFRERNEPATRELDFAEDYTAAYRKGTVLLPTARTVAVLQDPTGQMQMVYRTAPRGAMLSAGTEKPAHGPYTKLVRSADAFTGYCSPDGKTWTRIGEVAISMDEKVEVGMAVCSGDPATLAKATFSAFSRVEPTPAVRSKRR